MMNIMRMFLATQDKLSLLGWMLSVILVLGVTHNLLLAGNDIHNPFKRPYRELLLYEGRWLRLLFLCSTVVLMSIPAEIFNFTFFLVVVTAILSTVFIINSLHRVLSHLKENKIGIKFIRDENLLLLIFWVLFTEFIFLNHLLEHAPQDYQARFDMFIFGYTILLLLLAVYLSFPIQDKARRVWPQGRKFKVIVLSDPLLVIAVVLVCSHVAVIVHRNLS